MLRSERPVEPIIRRKTLNFRVNRFLTNLFNLFYRKGLRYKSLNSEESLRLLLETRKSYIRFGNGESEILVGLDMATQLYDRKLEKALKKIIEDYTPDCNYLLGLTNWCLTQSVKELKSTPKQTKYRIWRFMRYVFWKLGMSGIDMPFLEADMFRVGPVGLKREDIELLWRDMKKIIMVHNNEKYFQRFSEELGDKEKKTYFVRIPDKNFFSVLQETQEKIIDLIKENSINKNDLIILVSAGPGANVLCYNLCKDAGFLCYDMGNFFHMYYQNKC